MTVSDLVEFSWFIHFDIQGRCLWQFGFSHVPWRFSFIKKVRYSWHIPDHEIAGSSRRLSSSIQGWLMSIHICNCVTEVTTSLGERSWPPIKSWTDRRRTTFLCPDRLRALNVYGRRLSVLLSVSPVPDHQSRMEGRSNPEIGRRKPMTWVTRDPI